MSRTRIFGALAAGLVVLNLSAGLAAAATRAEDSGQPAVSQQDSDRQPAPSQHGAEDADMREMHEQMMRDHARMAEMCQRMMADMNRMHEGMMGGASNE